MSVGTNGKSDHPTTIQNPLARRVHVAGITAGPDGPWVTQLTRNATDAEDGFLRGTRLLIHDLERPRPDAQPPLPRGFDEPPDDHERLFPR